MGLEQRRETGGWWEGQRTWLGHGTCEIDEQQPLRPRCGSQIIVSPHRERGGDVAEIQSTQQPGGSDARRMEPVLIWIHPETSNRISSKDNDTDMGQGPPAALKARGERVISVSNATRRWSPYSLV